VEGFVTFAQQCALIIGTLLPTAMYACAIGFFLFGAWGLSQQSQPHNPFRGKPWIPILSILFAGASASFPTLLTKINASAGSSISVSIASGITSYTPDSSTSAILGNTPGEALINIITVFQGFFQAFGALACFWAMSTYRQSINGRSDKTWGSCGVQMVFGIMLINVLTISQWLVNIFSTSSAP
jgi:hypothetical protein